MISLNTGSATLPPVSWVRGNGVVEAYTNGDGDCFGADGKYWTPLAQFSLPKRVRRILQVAARALTRKRLNQSGI
jgi:hypothetical protein